MKLPINFPSQVEVISEEVARFRALSAAECVRALGEMFSLYHYLVEMSGRSEVLVRLAEEEEKSARQAIMKFVARHS